MPMLSWHIIMWLLAATAFALGQSVQDDVDLDNYVPELKPVKLCEDGTTFLEACNTCLCNKDGTRKFCTQNSCSTWGTFWSKIKKPFASAGNVCDPGREYKVGCHLCECDDEGDKIICPDGPCRIKGPILHKYFKLKKVKSIPPINQNDMMNIRK